MTVTNTTNSIYWVGNGVTSVYGYGFPVPSLEGFSVTRITRATGARLDITSACTITGIGGSSGGLVTMPMGAPLGAQYDLEIKRELPLKQTTDFSNQSTIYPETIEAALDYVTMCIIDMANAGDPNALRLQDGYADRWDAQTFPIKNLGDAVSGNDAVNYDQMVSEINAAITAALIGSGNVPAPTALETNYVLTATGAGTYDWVAPSGSIADGSVTNAKLADMATQRLKGRNTAGTGVPEDVTASQVLDWVDSTRGTLLYRGAAGWAGLDPSTANYILISNGAGADPSYVAPATASEMRQATANKYLTTTSVWDAAAEVSVAYAASIALDLNTGYNFAIGTLTGNITLSNPTNAKPGQSGYIRLVQDGTGGRTITFGTNWKKAASSANTLSTAASKIDYIFYTVRSTSEIIYNLTKDVA